MLKREKGNITSSGLPVCFPARFRFSICRGSIAFRRLSPRPVRGCRGLCGLLAFPSPCRVFSFSRATNRLSRCIPDLVRRRAARSVFRVSFYTSDYKALCTECKDGILHNIVQTLCTEFVHCVHNGLGSDTMSDKPFNQAAYIAEYKRTKQKRVPLDMSLSEYSDLQSAAAAAHQPINTYIKQAIRERVARDNAP